MSSPDACKPIQPSKCKVCGAQVSSDAPGGNCPACLWKLASSTLAAGASDGLSTPGAGFRRFGAYVLIEEIAHGGMGVVWRARQDGLGREVALKMILSGRLATSAQVLRFYTEARAAARLDHPNIVPIFEIGEDMGCHFYSMRLMEGPSLARALKEGGSFEPTRAARIVAATAQAVHFAHQRGVLHRDVKPSNILLDADGKPYVVDFGLARLTEEDSNASRTDAILGTPAYMAPEQASGPSRQVTTAADVYGLGAVLYELLTSRPPFEAESPLKTLRLVVEAEPRAPRAIDSRIDRSLDVICRKCLQKQPEKRYRTAAELADDLERWLAGKPILARPVSMPERFVAWARRRPELAGALGALLIALIFALVVSVASFVRVRSESEARAVALRSEEAQRLAFQSLAVVEANPGQALLLALEAAARGSSLSANNALLTSLEACREQRRLLGHAQGIHWASFSPDGELVATASADGTARIWSAADGEVRQILKGHAGEVSTAAFSPDGRRLVTAGRDATARIWDVGSGKEITVLAGHEHPLKSAAFSPDGERVLTVSQNTARIWNARTAQAIHVLDQHTEEVRCGVFSPDGSRVVTGSADKTAIIWDVSTGKALGKLAGHTAPIRDVQLSVDGKRIATASDPDARVWDAVTLSEISVLKGHEFAIYSLAFSPDGELIATGSEDFTARIWSATSGRELHVLPHGHKVFHLDISPDGSRLLTASYDRLARVWDLRTGVLIAEMKGHAAPLNHAEFSGDSRRIVTACVDCTARIWRVEPELPLLKPSRSRAGVVAADISPDGKSLATAELQGGTAQVMDLATRRVVAHLDAPEGKARALAYSLDGSRILSGSDDKTGRLWDAGTGRLLHTLVGHSAPIYFCSFSADGSLALTISEDKTARVWDGHTGEPAAMLPCSRPILVAVFSPDGAHVLLADEGWTVRIVDLSTGENQLLPRDRVGFVRSADFGPEGKTIITTSDTTRAQIRSLPEGTVQATLAHPARVLYAVYSPDKRWIATGATDATLRIWDAASREKSLEIRNAGYVGFRASFTGGASSVMVAWSPEGVRYAQTFQVGIYPLDVLAAARRARFADLTPDERDHFQVGTVEERRAHREAWRGGHIYGTAADEER